MTSFQLRFLALLQAHSERAGDITYVAERLRSNNLAVHSAARALERKGLIWITRSDSWGVLRFVIRRDRPGAMNPSET